MAVYYKILGQATVGSPKVFASISNKALTSNIATITTSAVHGLAVGDVITIAGVDATLDGTWVVASMPTTTTFTFAFTTTNITSAAVSPNGVLTETHNLGGVAVSNKVCVNGNATITTSSSHGFAVDDWVRLQIGDTNLDGPAKIVAVPSATTFVISRPGITVSSTSISGGAVGRMGSTNSAVYTVASGREAIISTVSITNSNATSAQYRLWTASSTSPTVAERLVYDGTVPASDTLTLTLGIALQAGKILVASANQPEITFQAYGSEIY